MKKIMVLLAVLALMLLMVPNAFAVSEVETNDKITTAQSIACNDSITGSIMSDDVDFYAFSLSESGRFTFNFTSYMTYYTLQLYDHEGTELWYDDNAMDSDVGFLKNSHIVDLEAGSYYFKITGDQYTHSSYTSNTSTGSYSLDCTFTACHATETELNNSFSVADPITVSDTNVGLIGQNDSFDLYKLTISTTDVFSLTFTSYMKYYTLEIYSPDGEELWCSDDNTFDESVGFRKDIYEFKLESGEYIFKVTGDQYAHPVYPTNSSTGSYQFSVTHEHTFGNWVIVEAPTTTSYGLEERVCSCGLIEQRTIEKLAEQPSETEPTAPSTPNESTDTEIEPTVPSTPDNSPDSEPTAPSFNDVEMNTWYYNSVNWAVAEMITTGTSDTTFSPNSFCSRGQVVTFLWRAAGCPEPISTSNPFSDVEEKHYYYKAVLWAVENNITTGITHSTFGPNASCTRAQVATLLWRTSGKPVASSNSHTFTDIKYDYYYDAVLWAVENGITNGTTSTTFSPDATCTRAQIVTLLHRYLG